MTTPAASTAEALAGLLRQQRRVLALTGAGCSTSSGIPDYRDADGAWKHARPILYPDFVASPEVRRRYWARSSLGWPRFAAARPNAAHVALAELEQQGLLTGVITQNVDGLHQRAGSRFVIDLHGRLDDVRCLGCKARLSRAAWQVELGDANPGWTTQAAEPAPDGDAAVSRLDQAGFRVPACKLCHGVLRPGVVFYGEAVPPAVRDAACHAVEQADALLVIGTSLMVFSGFRLVRDAAAAGKAVVAINLGRTRADAELTLRWHEDCAQALPQLRDLLLPSPRAPVTPS